MSLSCRRHTSPQRSHPHSYESPIYSLFVALPTGQKSEKGGLTRRAAVKLEREFASQELILKGLQRDNERKTIEVEALRRRLRAITDYLVAMHGEADWESVVLGASGGGGGGHGPSKGKGKSALPPMPEDILDATMASASSPERQRREIAKLQREVDGTSGTPSKIARVLGAAGAAAAAASPGMAGEGGQDDGRDTSFNELHERATQYVQSTGQPASSPLSDRRQDPDESDASWILSSGPRQAVRTERQAQLGESSNAAAEAMGMATPPMNDQDDEHAFARLGAHAGAPGNMGFATAHEGGSSDPVSDETSMPHGQEPRRPRQSSQHESASSSVLRAVQPASTPSHNLSTQPSEIEGRDSKSRWNTPLLLGSIESVRLLVQSFEKQNALRKEELERILLEAREAEERLKVIE